MKYPPEKRCNTPFESINNSFYQTVPHTQKMRQTVSALATLLLATVLSSCNCFTVTQDTVETRSHQRWGVFCLPTELIHVKTPFLPVLVMVEIFL